MTVSTKTKKACATGLAGIALATGANIAGAATASAASSIAVHTFPSTVAPTITTIQNPDCRNLVSHEGHQANGHNWVMVRADNGATGWAIDEGNSAWCI